MITRFRARYGARPLHLIALAASFALAAAAVLGWSDRRRDFAGVLEWFVAAIVLHDIVLLPLYSVLDRLTIGWVHRRVARGPGCRRHAVRPTPYLRVPVIVSALMLAVFFPVIFGLGARTELLASGIPEHSYLVRWLLLTGILFAASGAAYVVAVAAARRDEPRRPPRAPTRREPGSARR